MQKLAKSQQLAKRQGMAEKWAVAQSEVARNQILVAPIPKSGNNP